MRSLATLAVPTRCSCRPLPCHRLSRWPWEVVTPPAPMAALSPSASQQEGDPAVRRDGTCELPVAPQLIPCKTSLASVPVRGVERPTVHTAPGRVIGSKRSTDGRAYSPRRDLGSGNPALRIGSGPYEHPALQRLRACVASLACLVTLSFRFRLCQ